MERARGGVPSVGVVKRRVLRGLWRRLVGVGIIEPGLSGSGFYASIMAVAALFFPLPARPSPCALEAVRWVVGGEKMTTPGGMRTRYKSCHVTPRARRTGFYHGVGAPWLQGSGPSLRPGPRPQGVLMYSTGYGLGSYIRKQLPIRAAGLSRVQSKPLPGRARISHPPARPDLF